jgi:CRP-like cAMP-binding protein
LAFGPFRNTILKHLDEKSVERLQLRHIPLPQAHVLEQPGMETLELTFLEEGIASMTTMFQDGSQVEAGMFGPESAVGVSALMGLKAGMNFVAVQVPGYAYAARVDPAEAEFRQMNCFHDLVLRYMQSQVIQATQSTGCNARHNVQQRLARWLLLCRDRHTSDVLQLTQEFLAAMLGVERPSVSLVAGQLQEQGLIEYSRGRILIADRAGLERLACECYQVSRRELQSFERYADERTGYYRSRI